MQLDELMKTAYSVFPKEVSDRSENYKETSEHKRLLKHLELKETYSEYLNMLADNLIKLFPTYQFDNQSNLISYDRCVRGRFINKSLNTHLVSVYISLVIPSYIILQMPLEIKFNTIQEMNSGKLFKKYLNINVILHFK